MAVTTETFLWVSGIIIVLFLALLIPMLVEMVKLRSDINLHFPYQTET